jgi:hypothetical protein
MPPFVQRATAPNKPAKKNTPTSYPWTGRLRKAKPAGFLWRPGPFTDTQEVPYLPISEELSSIHSPELG